MSGPRLTGLIDAAAEQCQTIESVGSQLLLYRGLSTAIGTQLDIFGEILGCARNDRSDTPYRAALQFQVYLNTSEGQPNVILDALRFYTDATAVSLVELYPAAMVLWADTGGTGSIPDTLVPDLNKLRPGGVRIAGLSYNDSTNLSLCFKTETGYGAQRDGGFAEYSYDTTNSGGLAEELT